MHIVQHSRTAKISLLPTYLTTGHHKTEDCNP